MEQIKASATWHIIARRILVGTGPGFARPDLDHQLL